MLPLVGFGVTQMLRLTIVSKLSSSSLAADIQLIISTIGGIDSPDLDPL